MKKIAIIALAIIATSVIFAGGKQPAKAVPTAEDSAVVLPDTVKKYIAKWYPAVAITEVNRLEYGYDVKVSNGAKMQFSTTGKLLRKEK